MDLNELNKLLKEESKIINESPVEDFEGYSPTQMQLLLYHPFEPGSPIQFKETITDEVLHTIPFLQLCKAYLDIVKEEQPLKLTTRGNLLRRVVITLYEKKIILSEFIEKGYTKLWKEEDATAISAVRLVCEIAKLTKKRKNKLSLTNKAYRLLENEYQLFQLIFITFTTKFNWAYHDGYEDQDAGQLGFAYSLRMLSKYGSKERHEDFYGDKYMQTFPILLDSYVYRYVPSPEDQLKHCYLHRSFERAFNWFGLISTRHEGKRYFDRKTFIKKTEVLDKLFDFE